MKKDMIGIALIVIGLNIAAGGGYFLFEYMLLSSTPFAEEDIPPISGIRNIFLILGVMGLIVGLIMLFLGIKFYLEEGEESKRRKMMYQHQYPIQYERVYRRPPSQ